MRSKWIVVAALLIAILGIGILLYYLLQETTEITLMVTVSDATNDSPLHGVRVVVRGQELTTNEAGRAEFIQNVSEGDTLIVALYGRRETRVERRVVAPGDLVGGSKVINLPVKLMDTPIVGPDKSPLEIVATPSTGVTVAIDEGPPSDVPLTVSLPLGDHAFHFDRDGYTPIDTTVTVSLANPPLEVALSKRPGTGSGSTPGGATPGGEGKGSGTTPPVVPAPAAVAEPKPGCLEEALNSLEGDLAVIQALENCDDANFSQENKGLRQFLLGQAYLNTGKGEQALATLKLYIARYGRNDPLGYCLLADAEARHGDLQAAIDAYEEVEKRRHYIASPKQRDSICGESQFGEALAYLQMSRLPNNQLASENAQKAESLFEAFIEEYCGTHPKCAAANQHLKEVRDR